MNDALPVFVNGRCVRVGAGSAVGDAVALFDASLAGQVASGAAYITDGRGLRLPSDAPAHAGAILRVIVSARRDAEEADAHP